VSNNEESDAVDGSVPLAQVSPMVDRKLRNLELGLRVAMPARVVTYNAATQKVDARGEFLPILAGPNGTDIPDTPILFGQIPVAWPRAGAGTAYQTMPLAPNDTGYVLCMDRAISRWLTTGNPAAPVDPVSGRAHSLGDAVFIPGLHTDTDAITPPPSPTAHVIEGPPVAGVQLGATATMQVALASQLHTYITAAVAAGLAAAVPGSADGGTAAFTAMQAYLASNPFTSFATTKVVAE